MDRPTQSRRCWDCDQMRDYATFVTATTCRECGERNARVRAAERAVIEAAKAWVAANEESDAAFDALDSVEADRLRQAERTPLIDRYAAAERALDETGPAVCAAVRRLREVERG